MADVRAPASLAATPCTGEFPGFELGLLRDQQVKRGDNKHVLVLPLQKLTAEITVSRDRQMVASDRGLTFGTTLTREAIEALSDDPRRWRASSWRWRARARQSASTASRDSNCRPRRRSSRST